jgi:hypothetical protein
MLGPVPDVRLPLVPIPPLHWWLDCSVIAALVILYVTGHRFASTEPRMFRWGVRLGGIAFLFTFAQGLAAEGLADGATIFRCVAASLFLAAAVIVVAWHVLTVLTFALRQVWLPLHARLRLVGWRVRWWLTAGRRRREEAERAARARLEHAYEAPRRMAEAARDAERRRQEAAAQKRREDARAKVELFYALHGPSLGKRFTKASLTDFVGRYLGDDRPPEYVEERASQLLAVLQQHLDEAAPKPTKAPLDELLQSWHEQRDRLDREELPPEWKDTLSALLEQQLFEQMQRRMEQSP